MDQNETIQRQFGAAADRYRTSRYHQIAPDLDALRAEAQRLGGGRALDLGTGTGHTALAVAAHATEVVGVDLTPAMLEQARELAAERGAANVRFEVGDAAALPYADGSFDLVTCRVCAHHFVDARAALREVARVLRPGGAVLWIDSVAPEDAAQDTFLNCIERIRDPSHVRDYNVSQWRALFAEVGLAAEHRATWAVFQDFEDWTERMRTPQLARAQLRALFDDATEAVRAAFAVRGDPYGFDIPIAFLTAAAS